VTQSLSWTQGAQAGAPPVVPPLPDDEVELVLPEVPPDELLELAAAAIEVALVVVMAPLDPLVPLEPVVPVVLVVLELELEPRLVLVLLVADAVELAELLEPWVVLEATLPVALEPLAELPEDVPPPHATRRRATTPVPRGKLKLIRSPWVSALDARGA
jgi:hypothetical protein